MSPRTPAWAFALASFLALGCGCLVAGSTASRSAAWLLGALIAALLSRVRTERMFAGVLLTTPVVLLASFWNAGQSGVHHWISLGPLNVNAAFLCLPAAVVSFAAMARTNRVRWTAILIALELCLQPDASQATAFGAAILAACVMTRSSGVLGALVVVLAAASWARPDPLRPVPEVEGILGLARSVSVSLAAACVVSLAGVCLSPLLVRSARTAALALTAYFVISAMAPQFGAFPVPLVGMGMSPILGFWIGFGVLLAAVRGQERG